MTSSSPGGGSAVRDTPFSCPVESSVERVRPLRTSVGSEGPCGVTGPVDPWEPSDGNRRERSTNSLSVVVTTSLYLGLRLSGRPRKSVSVLWDRDPTNLGPGRKRGDTESTEDETEPKTTGARRPLEEGRTTRMR